MLDVRDQLRGYGEQLDAAATPIRLDELSAPVPARPRPSRPWTARRPRPGWAYALVAAVVVLIAVGGAAWLIGGGDGVEPPPATTLPPTTVTEPPPPTIPVTDALFPVTLGDRTIAGQWDLLGFGTDTGFRWEIISVADPALLAEGVALVMFPDMRPYGMAPGSDVWISGDGEVWEPVTFPGVTGEGDGAVATVSDIALAGSRLVAVGWIGPQTGDAQQGLVWTSEDGRFWTLVPDLTVLAGADVHDVASDGALLAAVGFDHESGPLGDVAVGRSVVWTSPDGVTWTRGEDDPLFADSIAYDIVHGPGGYLASGMVTPRPEGAAAMESVYFLSPDGHEWREIDLPAELRESWPYALAADQDGYVSTVYPWIGNSRSRWVSPDGITWQAETEAGQESAALNVPTALSETRIAFHTASIDEAEGAERYEVFVMNVDGSETTPLHQTLVGNQSPNDDAAADWSPDGTKLVFTSHRDWDYEIYVMNADGSDQRRLTDSPGSDGFADWSPDGSRLAFEREGPDGTRDIWVMNADGSGQVNLTNDSDHSYITAAWSPDGTRIAFSSDRDAPPELCADYCSLDIYLMNSDGSNIVRLTDGPANEAFPEWSPDGTRVLFHSTELELIEGVDADFWVPTNFDVYVMNADGTGPVNLTDHPAMDAHAVWSPDGTRIAFNSTRDGNVEIYLMDGDGANVTRITHTSTLEEWWPSWSPIP